MNEELKIIISAEIDKLRKDLDKGRKQLENFEKQGSSAGEKFGKAMGTMGKVTGAAMKAIGTAAVAGIAAIVGLSESTKEYSANQAKLKTAFETAGSSAEQATQTYNDLYRVLGDSDVAVEAAGHLAQLTTDQKALAEWTDVCQGVYATFGDSLPIESLTEAANETAKTGEVTGALADALNWAGVSEDEFADQLFWCNTEAEREALIRSTLTDLYGEASEAYEKNAADILAANEAQAALTASLAALGEAVRPIVTIFKDELAVILQELVPHLNLVAEGLQAIMNGDEGGAAKMSEGISNILTTLITKITELLPTVLTIGIQIITSLIEGILAALPSVIQTVVDAIPLILDALITLIPKITEALLNALPLLLDAILQIVAEIIVALGELLPTIVIQIIEIVPQLVQSLLENIPVLLEAAITFLLAIVNAIPEIIPAIVEALPLIIESIINTLIDALPILLQGAIQLFMAIVKAIPQIIPQLITALFSIVTTVQTTLLGRLGDVFKGIWDGLVSIFKNVPSYFRSQFQGALTNIKAVFSGLANYFSGIWNSIKNIFSKVGATIGNAITNTVKTAINGVLSTAVKIINGFIKAINVAISVINAIPGVNIKKLSELNVPKLARGGVIDTATLAMVGENGKEAVVPLENNTEWLDMLTDRIVNALNGGSKPIYLQVDGRTFAQISVDSINKLTKQRGSLPLVLA